MRFATECSYDFVFVYDDASMSSRLASLSGEMKDVPVITSRSGQLLVRLYSDPNYVLEGFEANVSLAEPCLCGNHGYCKETLCFCDVGWSGFRCDQCAHGYSGSDCRIDSPHAE